jgi:hypothetical protein
MTVLLCDQRSARISRPEPCEILHEKFCAKKWGNWSGYLLLVVCQANNYLLVG